MIAELTARSAGHAAIVCEAVAWPIGGGDDALELVDRVRHDRARVQHIGRGEAGFDDGADLVHASRSAERGAQTRRQCRHDREHAGIVGHGGRFDEGGEKCRAVRWRQLVERLIQRGGERRLERVAHVRALCRAVAPQEKRERRRGGRGAVGQRVQHVVGEAIEVGGQSGNYNKGMLVIRYTALLALVVWLGGMIILGLIVAPSMFEVLQTANPATGRELAGSLFGTIFWHFHLVAYACAFVILTCLFAIKFLGPPPASFIPRVSIVVVMLIVAVYSGYPVARGTVPVPSHHETSTALMTINMTLGLVLLFWYVRE